LPCIYNWSVIQRDITNSLHASYKAMCILLIELWWQT
jgi:hypothetical protein